MLLTLGSMTAGLKEYLPTNSSPGTFYHAFIWDILSGGHTLLAHEGCQTPVKVGIQMGTDALGLN